MHAHARTHTHTHTGPLLAVSVPHASGGGASFYILGKNIKLAEIECTIILYNCTIIKNRLIIVQLLSFTIIKNNGGPLHN